MVSTRRSDGLLQAKDDSLRRLAFADKLSASSTDALLKKLLALHKELAAFDQDHIDRDSLSGVRRQLFHTSILLHKDRGVKAYAACCIADLLRLYAPDAPYTQSELRDIFAFFFRQLATGLRGAESSYYNQYFHLLESLSTVKSVVLVCDLPGADELMAGIFKDLFTLVRRELPRKIEMFMADILAALLDEATGVTQEILECILAQFTPVDSPAHRLAAAVAASSSDKLQRPISVYFADTLVSSQRSHHSPDSDDELDSSVSNSVRTLHALLPILHIAHPPLISAILPQLEEELKMSHPAIRIIATSTLGTMFAASSSAAPDAARNVRVGTELARRNQGLWAGWLARRNDRDREVRLAWLASARGLVGYGWGEVVPGTGTASATTTTTTTTETMHAKLEAAIASKLLDPDERVRAAVCRMYAELDYETLLHHVSQHVLQEIGARGLDKKMGVRTEALACIARMFGLAYTELENGDPAAIQHFGWIPNSLLQMATISGDVKAGVESVLHTHILPPIDDVGSATERLLNVMKFLDDKSQRTLLSLSGLKMVRPSLYDHYVEICVRWNGGVVDENEEGVTRRLGLVVQRLASQFPFDQQKTSDDLHKFAKLNSPRLYKLMKTCLDPQSDVKVSTKAGKEFFKRLDAALHATFGVFMRRAGFWMINQAYVPFLLLAVRRASPGYQEDVGGGDASQTQSQTQTQTQTQQRRESSVQQSHTLLAAQNAVKVMGLVSKWCPALFKPHARELVGGLYSADGDDEDDEDEDGEDEADETMVQVCLSALSALVRWDVEADGGIIRNDRRMKERVKKLALGNHARHAKFASQILILAFGRSKQEGGVVDDLVETIARNLPTADPMTLAAHTTVLVQLARYAPDALERRSDVVIPFLIKKLLMVPTLVDEDGMQTEEEWMEDDELDPTTVAKVQAIKVCRYRCIAHAKSRTAGDMVRPVLKLLGSILENSGSVRPMSGDEVEDDPRVMSRMRLQAAVSLLHLGTVEKYAVASAPMFVKLALTIQDPCYNVRITFLTKLIPLISQCKLPAKYNVIPFLTVHDPETEVKFLAQGYVMQTFKTSNPSFKLEYYEMIFIRLIHLLAHHPDFATSHDDLVDASKYLDFYIEYIASSETVSLLYHLAGKGKTVRDAESQSYSKNLYVLCELAQELIKIYAGAHSWSIQSYPGKIKLPSDILRALPSPEAASENVKTVYLPEKTLAWVLESKKEMAAKERDREREERKALDAAATTTSAGTTSAGKRKAKSEPKTNGHSKKRVTKKRRKSNVDDDDEDEEDQDEDEDDYYGYRAGKDTDGEEQRTDDDDEGGPETSDLDDEEDQVQLGRGARSKNKAKLQRQARKDQKKKKAAAAAASPRRESSPLSSVSDTEADDEIED